MIGGVVWSAGLREKKISEISYKNCIFNVYAERPLANGFPPNLTLLEIMPT